MPNSTWAERARFLAAEMESLRDDSDFPMQAELDDTAYELRKDANTWEKNHPLKTCPKCRGSGYLYSNGDWHSECEICHGLGRIPDGEAKP